MTGWNEEPVVFDCEGDRLVGILHRTTVPDPKLGVLVVVGGPQYRVGSHRQFVLMARELAAAGYPVLRFDYRGMGDSDGAVRTFEDVEADLQAATTVFQKAVPDLAGIVLWGLCDAASAIMMSASPPVVKGRVLVNPWARTEAGEARAYARHYYLRRLLQRDFWNRLVSGALDVRRSVGQFIETLLRSMSPRGGSNGASYIERMHAGALSFRSPTLLMLSGRDLTARAFEMTCASDRRWRQAIRTGSHGRVRLATADHTWSNRQDLALATRSMIGWLSILASGGKR